MLDESCEPPVGMEWLALTRLVRAGRELEESRISLVKAVILITGIHRFQRDVSTVEEFGIYSCRVSFRELLPVIHSELEGANVNPTLINR